MKGKRSRIVRIRGTIFAIVAAVILPTGGLAQRTAPSIAGSYDGTGTNTITTAGMSPRAMPTRPGRFVLAPAAAGDVSVTMSGTDGSEPCALRGRAQGNVVMMTPGAACTVTGRSTMTVVSGRVTLTGSDLAVDMTMTMQVPGEDGGVMNVTNHYVFNGRRRP